MAPFLFCDKIMCVLQKQKTSKFNTKEWIRQIYKLQYNGYRIASYHTFSHFPICSAPYLFAISLILLWTSSKLLQVLPIPCRLSVEKALGVSCIFKYSFLPSFYFFYQCLCFLFTAHFPTSNIQIYNYSSF